MVSASCYCHPRTEMDDVIRLESEVGLTYRMPPYMAMHTNGPPPKV